MAYANGLIPLSAMRQLSTGGYLLANAAGAFEAWRIQARAAGFDMRPTSNSDAFRPLAVQEAIFFARYSRTDYGRRTNGAVKVYQGVVYYLKPGFAVAATPGSSNHGKGLAVDIRNSGGFGGAYHNWMSRTGPALGFNNIEGRSINEPWHWVHSGAFTVSNPIGGNGSITIPNIPGAPAPIEEDELSAADVEKILGAINTVAVEARQNAAKVVALETELANVKAGIWYGGSAKIDGVVQKFNYGVLPIAAHNQKLIAQSIGKTAALEEAVRQIAAGSGTPLDTVAIEAAVKRALKGASFTIETKG